MKEEIKRMIREKPILAEQTEVEPDLYKKIKDKENLTNEDYNKLAKILMRKLKPQSGAGGK
ncbi:MAG TPA: hypothetical protein VMV95_03010 [Bacillota bacterium]|nr:hypothetical protein [Bacillota bacterium]